MTRLDALLQFANNRKRDTWAVYGYTILPETQTEFVQDTIFQLNAPTSIWHNCIFYCTKTIEETNPIDWATYTFNDQPKGTIWNADHIIHPYLYCVLTATDLASIVEPVDLSFKPFAMIDPIEISDDDLNKILVDIGVPFISLSELEFEREQILKTMIKPAMDEYFKWYPIITVDQFPLATPYINIPIPPYAVSVSRAYINPGYPMVGLHQNPITRYFDEVILSASTRGTFANPAINYMKRQGFADTGAYSTFLLEKAVRQGAINHGARKRIRVELKNRRVIGYSNIQGFIEIEWGATSNYWDDIPFNRQSEVRDLCQAKILRAFASLRSQTSTELPGNLKYDHFFARADELEKRVIELWRGSTKAVVVRS